jgi:hypothetical protein
MKQTSLLRSRLGISINRQQQVLDKVRKNFLKSKHVQRWKRLPLVVVTPCHCTLYRNSSVLVEDSQELSLIQLNSSLISAKSCNVQQPDHKGMWKYRDRFAVAPCIETWLNPERRVSYPNRRMYVYTYTGVWVYEWIARATVMRNKPRTDVARLLTHNQAPNENPDNRSNPVYTK